MASIRSINVKYTCITGLSLRRALPNFTQNNDLLINMMMPIKQSSSVGIKFLCSSVETEPLRTSVEIEPLCTSVAIEPFPSRIGVEIVVVVIVCGY